MGKSSSAASIKKKHSKYSSQGRSRKRNLTRRSKSKKVRYHIDSDSYSTSSLSVSSFDSEDSYRSRRSRSRTRKDVKGSKKRARVQSSSSDESPHVRKRKGSKNSDKRKKTQENKMGKRRKKRDGRDAIISSRSNGSWSCSTCHSPSNGSDESEYEKSNGRFERREEKKRKPENIKNGAKRRKYKSGSCSSCGGHDRNSHFLTSNIMTGENTSKRLRSVITLPGEDNDGRDLDNDKHKEEITCDHDDYPLSRSNDSNDHLNDREKMPIEHVKREDAVGSYTETIVLAESDKDRKGWHARYKPGYDIVGTSDAAKEKNEVSGVNADFVNGDDLETSLRQKALENLKRFRSGPGGLLTNAKGSVNQKDKSRCTVKAPSTAMPELGQIRSPKEDVTGMVREDSAHSSQNEKFPNGRNCGYESQSAKNYVHSPNMVALPLREKVSTVADSSKNKPQLITSASSQAFSNVTTTLKETPAPGEFNRTKFMNRSSVGKSATLKETSGSQGANQARLVSGSSVSKCATPSEAHASSETNRAKLVSSSSVGSSATLEKTSAFLQANQAKSVNGSSVGKSATHGAHTTTPSSGNVDKVYDASVSAHTEPSSCIASGAADVGPNQSQDESKEGSQLEQKTMSVMRGGEMVQVKYKVYIPKKTPALARRQLKR